MEGLGNSLRIQPLFIRFHYYVRNANRRPLRVSHVVAEANEGRLYSQATYKVFILLVQSQALVHWSVEIRNNTPFQPISTSNPFRPVSLNASSTQKYDVHLGSNRGWHFISSILRTTSLGLMPSFTIWRVLSFRREIISEGVLSNSSA